MMFGMIQLRLHTILSGLLLLLFAPTIAHADQADPDAGKSIAQVEKELAPMARFILNDSSTDAKIEANKEFIVRLTNLLKRPDSYEYAFDSLKTVSRLAPQDNSFRIFTWFIVDNPQMAYFSEYAHYYFGLVQRKYVDAKGQIHYLVIPLMELEQNPKGLESIVTDNLSWFGALYYKPKDAKHIPAYDGFYYRLEPGKGDVKHDPNAKEEVITYIPGKYKGRTIKEVDQPKYSNYRRVKTETRYYLLMGWNGWDNTANFKVVDVLSFDPTDSMKVNFGAPIFYFDRIPKARALFKYADYATFTMNFADVRRGPFKLFSKRMLVYDHLSPPQKARPMDQYDLGPDGSYDALSYFGRYGGYFEWYRNVETKEKSNSRQHQKEMAKLQAQHAKGDSTLPYYEYLMTNRQMRMGERAAEKASKKQKKELERKLKESGIEIPKGKREE
jgi:hypothetical protein